MDIHASVFPKTITVRDTPGTDPRWPVTVHIDKTVRCHLTVDLARDLWHELIAVLQAYDHDADAEAAREDAEDDIGVDMVTKR